MGDQSMHVFKEERHIEISVIIVVMSVIMIVIIIIIITELHNKTEYVEHCKPSSIIHILLQILFTKLYYFIMITTTSSCMGDKGTRGSSIKWPSTGCTVWGRFPGWIVIILFL
jgi:hypothetical protein